MKCGRQEYFGVVRDDPLREDKDFGRKICSLSRVPTLVLKRGRFGKGLSGGEVGLSS